MNDLCDHPDLVALIDAAIDGAIDDADLGALMDRFRSDAEARRLYRERAQLHALLHWIGGREIAEAIPQHGAVSAEPAAQAIPVREPVVVGGSDLRAFWLGIAAVAVAAFIIATVGIGSFAWFGSDSPETEPPAGPVVATMLRSDGVTWRSRPIYDGEDVHAHPLSIDGGDVHMHTRNGIDLTFRGRTDAAVRVDGDVRLSLGTLHAVVPRNARGFTVHAPGGLRIRDLGTAFTVRIDDDGQARIDVDEGRVEFAFDDGPPQLIEAGSAAVVSIADQSATVESAHRWDGLIHRWTFERSDARDDIGEAHGELLGGARIEGGRLVLDGIDDMVRTAPIAHTLTEKTLVVWVEPANLTQRGGGVFTLETPGSGGGPRLDDVFDSIVLGELTEGQWMGGSDFFKRTPVDNGGSLQTAAEPVAIAIVYTADGTVTLYRDGERYARYASSGPVEFVAGDARVLMGLRLSGLRHQRGSPGGTDHFFAGAIEEARLYRRALSADDIADLEAVPPRDPEPAEEPQPSHRLEGDTP